MGYPKRLAVLALLALFLGGCVTYSLNPIGESADYVLLPGLVGKWVETGGKEGFRVTKDKTGDTYLFKPSDSPVPYRGFVVKIDDATFLDLSTAQDRHDDTLVPIHLILRLDLTGDRVEMVGLDDEVLSKEIWNGKLKVPSAALKGDLLLTGTTPELVKFLRKALRHPHYFSKTRSAYLRR